MNLWRRLERCSRDFGYGLTEPVPDATNAAEDGSGAFEAASYGTGNASKIVSEAATAERPDFDRAWKDALRWWLPDCLRLFWPAIHDQINWTIPPEFLATELRRLQKVIQPDVRYVDQLAKVRLNQGHDALLLIHIEVQTRRAGKTLALRMLRYHHRLFEAYPGYTHFPCAILLDRKRGPEVETFRVPVLGGEHVFRFPVVNLAAWETRQHELHSIAPTNPFAVVVLAQLACRATRPDQARLVSKLELAKLLKYWGYSVDKRFQLMLVIDTLLTLPEPLEDAFYTAAQHIEDEHTMERLNSFQRVRLRRERQAAEEIGMQKGLQAGLAKGIQQGLEQGIEQGAHTGIAGMLHAQLQQKFGDLPDWVSQRLQHADTAVLQHWVVRFVHAQSLHDVLES